MASNNKRPSLRSDAEAWELVADNTGLVWWTIHRYFYGADRSESELQEMYSSGILGLFRAAQLWDPAVAKFSTYGPLWIRQQIARDVLEGTDTFTRASRRNGDPAPVSLDQSAPGSDAALADLLESNGGFELTVASDDFMRFVREACTGPMDDAIIDRLSGINPVSRGEIGAWFGVTGERVRRREQSVVAHLAQKLAAHR